LPEHERELLLGWRDVVEGIFEVHGRDGDALIVENLVDELTYRVSSNMGLSVFQTAGTRQIHDRPARAGRARLVDQRQLRLLSEK
jgi:hypothetical protein